MNNFFEDSIFQEKANDKLDQIRKSVLDYDYKDNSLYMGKMGSAIFLGYYAKFKQDNTTFDQSLEFIQQVFQDLNTNSQSNNLSVLNGITGILLGLINYSESIYEIDDSLYLDFDEVIGDYTLSKFETHFIEYLGGGVIGGAIYLLKRAKKSEIAFQYLQKVINKFEETAQDNDGHITWKNSVVDIEGNVSYAYDLGIPHGICAVLLFFSKMIQEDLLVDQCKKLLTESSLWLTKQMYPFDYTCRYPTSAQNFKEGSRLGWCYGDLAVCTTLFNAGIALDNKFILDNAYETLNKTFPRKEYLDSLVSDYCLCHGSSGVGYMYKKLYKLSNKEECKEASKFWYNKLLEKTEHTDGLAGFKFQMPHLEWVNSIGLLEGNSGIGLSLISSFSEDTSCDNWSELFLL